MSEQKQCESNFFYFESPTMQGLYDCLKNWQATTQKRIYSLSIQQDLGNFCCIVFADSKELTQTLLTPYEKDMERFRRKALKHVGVGINFSTDNIKPEKVLGIQKQLEKCKTTQEIQAVFLEAYSTN